MKTPWYIRFTWTAWAGSAVALILLLTGLSAAVGAPPSDGEATERSSGAKAREAVLLSYNALMEAFSRDVRDAVWGAEKEAVIRQRMASLPLGASAEVECRTSYCRVESRWPSAPEDRALAEEGFAQTWMREEPCEFHVPAVAVMDESQPNRLVVIIRCDRR